MSKKSKKSLGTCLETIFNAVSDLSHIDEAVGALFFRANDIALRALQAAAKDNGDVSTRDFEEQLRLVSDVLKVDLQELIRHVVTQYLAVDEINKKEADRETLDFITKAQDVDDYEKFLEDNNVQQNVDFLKKEI